MGDRERVRGRVTVRGWSGTVTAVRGSSRCWWVYQVRGWRRRGGGGGGVGVGEKASVGSCCCCCISSMLRLRFWFACWFSHLGLCYFFHSIPPEAKSHPIPYHQSYPVTSHHIRRHTGHGMLEGRARQPPALQGGGRTWGCESPHTAWHDVPLYTFILVGLSIE